MARELSAGHTRMKITGSDTAPSTLDTEYAVKNGDLFEAPKVKNTASPTWSNTMATLWAGCVSAVKTDEGIT